MASDKQLIATYLKSGGQNVFAGRLAWVSEAGREVRLGLLHDAVSGRRGSARLAVRVVALARKCNTSAWKSVGNFQSFYRWPEAVPQQFPSKDGVAED